jgi:nucleotide-binding universal stress UspA family protein
MTRLFRNVLVPYDFSDAAHAALTVASDLATRERGTLTVLHAIAPVYPVSGFAGAGEMPVWIPPDDLQAETRTRLAAEVARVLGRRAARVTCKVVVGDPYHCIVAAARRVDSIVMGTVGRTGLAHLVIGSVAEKVVRHAPVPVLTLRPAASRRALRATVGGRSGTAPRAGRARKGPRKAPRRAVRRRP